MRQIGVWNQDFGAEAFGFDALAGVNWNLGPAALVERAVRRGEGALASSGALTVDTGPHTGRSADDKFIVRDETTEAAVDWSAHASLTPEQFESLRQDFLAHAQGRELFAQDLYVGADPERRLSVRTFSEYAWRSMAARTFLIAPPQNELAGFTPQLTVLDMPSFRADPARHGVRSATVVAIDLTRRIALIGGTSYAGEIKHAILTVMNHLLPERGALPLHCAASIGPEGDVALFIGLSATGKTTLAADAERSLLGDDAHGWGPDGVFNLEGGCYAKAADLSAEGEPALHAAAQRFGVLLENVPLDPETREPNFAAGARTENTRCAFPLSAYPRASATAVAGHPKNLVLLTCDPHGVMPPIARLTPEQAVYHFLSGYTARIADAEKGAREPRATFSACYAAPFMPRPAVVYGEMLSRLIAEHGVNCWLVNTGWTGGAYGSGRRVPLEATRALIAAAFDGSLDEVESYTDKFFGFTVPLSVPGVDTRLFRPRKAWADKRVYIATARQVLTMFQSNFASFGDAVDPEIAAAGPHEYREAAE